MTAAASQPRSSISNDELVLLEETAGDSNE